jgi:hypothetical protein
LRECIVNYPKKPLARQQATGACPQMAFIVAFIVAFVVAFVGVIIGKIVFWCIALIFKHSAIPLFRYSSITS